MCATSHWILRNLGNQPNNKEIAGLLNAIADALEIKAEDKFRIRAFRGAARRVEVSEVGVADALTKGRLEKLPGIGKRMGQIISQYVNTGYSSELDKSRAGIPSGVFDILTIHGIGPKTASRLFNQLEVIDVDSLEAAVNSGQLGQLPGMGPKKEESYRREIKRYRERKGTFRLGQALPESMALLAALEASSSFKTGQVAGEIRRGCATVRTIELVCTCTNSDEFIRTLEGICHIDKLGADIASGSTQSGIPVLIHLTPPDHFAATMIRNSCSPDHLKKISELASAQGIQLGNSGPITYLSDEPLSLSDENEFFKLLGLQFIPVELREDNGEIEAAQRNQLPRLVELGDLQGDLHTHTRYSDGAHSVAEMAIGGEGLGHQYLVVSDHSQSLVIANGLTPERLREQAAEIIATDSQMSDLALLHGSEVDILTDGSLDFEQSELSRLDWVTASVHTSFQQPLMDMTQRIISAIRHIGSDAIGHPTGRLLNVRDGYDFDTDAVFAAAAETGTALEINAMPERLDLSDELARQAIIMGAEIVINTDAHALDHLDFLPYGITTARRAGITKEQVVNTKDLNELREWRRARVAKSRL